MMENNLKINDLCEFPDFTGKCLSIEICGSCNSRCVYCFYYITGQHKMNNHMIDENLFYKLVDEAYELGIRKIGLYIQGEPLLNPNICKYISYVKEKGYEYIYISTNGLICDSIRLKNMVEAGLDSLKFSINAFSSETFLLHNGIKGFETVKKNIINAAEYRKKSLFNFQIYIFYIETKFNMTETELAKRFYSQYCDDFIVHSVVNGPIDMIGIEDKLVTKKARYYSPRLPCSEPFNRIAIDVDGFLLTCCNPAFSLNRVADLKNINLSEALYGDVFVDFRKKHLKKNISGTICCRCMNFSNREIVYPICQTYSEPFLDDGVDFLSIWQERMCKCEK